MNRTKVASELKITKELTGGIDLQEQYAKVKAQKKSLKLVLESIEDVTETMDAYSKTVASMSAINNVVNGLHFAREKAKQALLAIGDVEKNLPTVIKRAGAR